METNPAHQNLSEEEMAAATAAALGGGPETMVLTQTEVNRALQIKDAVQSQSHIKPLTDFEYVQYAMCCEQDETMDQIFHRMEMMQAFKEEYKIADTAEDGVDVIHQLNKEQPGFFLSIAYLPSTKNYLSVIDWAQLFPSRFKTWEQDRKFMGYLYYSCQAKSCQFQALREGSSIMVECMGVGTENFDSRFFSRMQHELLLWLPKLQKETFLLNSPSIANMAFALWRKFMRPDQKQALHMGHKIEGLEGQRIAELYKIPTLEIAEQHLLLNVKIFLQHRYQMEQEFRLPNAPLGGEDELLYGAEGLYEGGDDSEGS